MTTSIICTLEDFSQRILQKRVLIPTDDPAKARLLPELLTLELEIRRHNLASFSNAKLTFKTRLVNGAYTLLVRLDQAQVKSMKFAFKNPYKKAFEIFDSLPSSFASIDEEKFKIAKERAIRAYQRERHLDYKKAFLDSYHGEKGSLSKKSFDPILLSEMEKLLKGMKTIDYLYVGPKSKEDLNLMNKGEALPSFTPEKLTDLYDPSLEREGVFFTLSLPNEVKNEADYRTGYLALMMVKDQVLENLAHIYGSPCLGECGFLSKKEGYLFVSVEKGKVNTLAEMLSRVLPLGEGIDVSKAETPYEDFLLSRLSDIQESVKDLTTYQELGLEEVKAEDFYQAIEIAPEAIRNFASGIKAEEKVKLCKESEEIAHA